MFILDNGHGVNTPGKRSPVWEDGSQLFEWKFNRLIVDGISDELNKLNIPNFILTPEEEDVSLSKRIERANNLYKLNPDSVLISVHANAGGGTGWEVFTSKGETKSDKYAEIFYEEAKKELINFKMRVDLTDNDNDKEENFYILRKSLMPAVLTENLFMDTEKDCKFLLSDTGVNSIINLHVNAIKRIWKLL